MGLPCNDENGLAHSRAQVHFWGETVERISGKSCVSRLLAHQRPVWCRFQVAIEVQKSPILQRKSLHTDGPCNHENRPCNHENGFADGRAKIHFFGTSVTTITRKRWFSLQQDHHQPACSRIWFAIEVRKSPILQRMVARKQRKHYIQDGEQIVPCLPCKLLQRIVARKQRKGFLSLLGQQQGSCFG